MNDPAASSGVSNGLTSISFAASCGEYTQARFNSNSVAYLKSYNIQKISLFRLYLWQKGFKPTSYLAFAILYLTSIF